MKQTRSLSEFSCLSEYTRLYSIALQEKWQQIPRAEIRCTVSSMPDRCRVLLDFSLSVKAAPHECVIRTGQL